MIVDGRKIADGMLDEIQSKIAICAGVPKLTVFTCAPNFATKKFLSIKQKAAARVGVMLHVEDFDPDVTTEMVIEKINELMPHTHGVIVQLPFPAHIDIEEVFKILPAAYDVDAIGLEATQKAKEGSSEVLSPVVGAIVEIIEREEIEVVGKQVVVIGRGRLVGTPSAAWFKNSGAEVVVLDKESDKKEAAIKTADILVLGAGVSRMVTPEMVKEGVVIFDAGTSEDAGELVGDADPGCVSKAAVFTPVPGGIGPITIAVIFKNLLVLGKGRMEELDDGGTN